MRLKFCYKKYYFSISSCIPCSNNEKRWYVNEDEEAKKEDDSWSQSKKGAKYFRGSKGRPV